MTGTALALLLAISAPPPQRDRDPVLFREAEVFAQWTIQLAASVADQYAKPVKVEELLTAGLTALYDAAGKKVPMELSEKLKAGNGDYYSVLIEARVILGNEEAVSGLRAFVLAVNGFSKVTDPYCGLMWQKNASFATSDAEFSLGFELEGVTTPTWIAYLLECQSAAVAGIGEGNRSPKPPVATPWLVRRVIPGSPAAAAGLRVGDHITHFFGEEVTPNSNPNLFRKLASIVVPNLRDPMTAVDVSQPVALKVRREGVAKPLEIEVMRNSYMPESIFGAMRQKDGTWDFLIDKPAKIGYIRVGSIENPAAEAFNKALADLVREGAEGLVLDLRWCPGGYVTPTNHIAAALLPPGKVIATVKKRNPGNFDTPDTLYSDVNPALGRLRTLPVVVLVNGETTGGGEMIAAALQDHDRATIVGQRTFGKANIMMAISSNTNFPMLQYRVSTGYSLRSTGIDRHRFPDSKLTDNWGVRPGKGFWIPTTPDLAKRLKADAERQATRPPTDDESVRFDDPLEDPQKLIAVKLLKEKLK